MILEDPRQPMSFGDKLHIICLFALITTPLIMVLM